MGWTETFDCDLTDEQTRLCEWIAEQAQADVRRISYQEAQDALGIVSDRELTCMLRNMRERMDGLHAMIQSPIVHTHSPYFDLHVDAGRIWDSYRRAEAHSVDPERDALGLHAAALSC
jgi:hypothetical protein